MTEHSPDNIPIPAKPQRVSDYRCPTDTELRRIFGRMIRTCFARNVKAPDDLDLMRCHRKAKAHNYRCHCGVEMQWLGATGKDRLSLQHEADGGFSFMCISCNVKSGVKTAKIEEKERHRIDRSVALLSARQHEREARKLEKLHQAEIVARERDRLAAAQRYWKRRERSKELEYRNRNNKHANGVPCVKSTKVITFVLNHWKWYLRFLHYIGKDERWFIQRGGKWAGLNKLVTQGRRPLNDYHRSFANFHPRIDEFANSIVAEHKITVSARIKNRQVNYNDEEYRISEQLPWEARRLYR